METWKTLNSHSSLETEEWRWSNQPSWFHIILQSSSHQNSMVLAQKQKYRPVEQDRKPRIKPMHRSVQFSSVAQSCATLCDSMDCSTPGLPVHHQFPELTQTHIHWVGVAIQPPHSLWSPSPPIFNLSQHVGVFKWVSSLHQMAKVSEFQLQRQSLQWIFRADCL